MRKLLILLLICILANQVLTRSLKHRSRRHQQDEGDQPSNSTGDGDQGQGGEGEGEGDQVDVCVEHDCKGDFISCLDAEDCYKELRDCSVQQEQDPKNPEAFKNCLESHEKLNKLFFCVAHDCFGMKDQEVLTRFAKRHH